MLRPKDLCQGSGTKTFLEAMHSGKVHLARFILDALDGRIINSKTENSKTPLMFAVSLPDPATRVKFTRLLLEKGADVNCQDDEGRTALSLACELGHLDVVKLLVQFNADPEISDTWGNSALMYAACSGHSQVLEFLIRAFKRLGLKLDRTNQAGHSAIQVANFFGHNQCVQALSIPGNKCLGLEEQLVDVSRKEQGETRRPNRLPRQVLERFTKQFHSKCEDHLPAVFQKQLRVGDSNGLRKRVKVQNQSPEKKGQQQPFINQLHRNVDKDGQEIKSTALFTVKQMQNCKLKDRKGFKTEGTAEQSNAGGYKDTEVTQEEIERIPVWSKAKSFNSEQSDQGGLSDTTDPSIRVRRGSLQGEQSVIAKMQYQENSYFVMNDSDKYVTAPKTLLNHKRREQSVQLEHSQPANINLSSKENDSSAHSGIRMCQKRLSLPQYGRPDKLLTQRVEMPPERIQMRPPMISALGTRLLRRFTAPEFLKLVKDFPSVSDGERVRMSRSETFPLSYTHQKVNNQPSVDSISGVKCEFEHNGYNVIHNV
nr:PREDICTED: ankyrin repeat domain-containing protein 63 [Lepisosteus oculatus]